MIKKIGEGFMFTIGVMLALTVVNAANSAMDDLVKKAKESGEKAE